MINKKKQTKKRSLSVVYDAPKKVRYVNRLRRSREARAVNINILKDKTKELVEKINTLDAKLNDVVLELKNINKTVYDQSKLSLIWSAKKNSIGLYGPYWIISFNNGIKWTNAKFKRENFENIKKPKTRRTPSPLYIRELYRNNQNEVLAVLKSIKLITKERKVHLNRYIKICDGLHKIKRQAGLIKHLQTIYQEKRPRDNFTEGLLYRDLYLSSIFRHFDLALDDIESSEGYIDRHMLQANLKTPQRFMALGISWALFSDSRRRKAGKLSIFGPVKPEWYQINRFTVNTTGDGVRQLKRLKELTRDHISKGQQGKIKNELLRIASKIKVLEKYRQARINVLQNIWRLFKHEFTNKEDSND